MTGKNARFSHILNRIFKKSSPRDFALDLGSDLVGSILYAIGIYTFASRADFAPGGISGLSLILNHLWRQVPALSTVMNSGAAIWFYLFFIGYVVTRKIMSLTTLPVILLILYWGTCMLGPCALVRYIYPLFAFLPFVLAGFVAPCNNAMSEAG